MPTPDRIPLASDPTASDPTVWKAPTPEPTAPEPAVPQQATPGSVATATKPPIAPPVAVPIRPQRPSWLLTVWPRAAGAAPRPAVLGMIIAAVVAMFLLVWQRPGVSWLAVGLAIGGAVRATRRRSGVSRRPSAVGIAWSVAALALLAVGAVRADGLLVTWCVLAAIVCGSLAVAGGRTVRGVGLGGYAVVIAAFRSPMWWVRGARQLRGGARATVRIARTAGVSLALVLVFGLLFASADGAFAHLASFVVPSISGSSFGRAFVALLLVVPVVLGLTYLAAGDPPFDTLPEGRDRTVRRAEWAVPVVVLNVLFAAFVGVQLEFLFGGRDRVLRTSGLTYAEYARSGFWQLLIVVALTVIVIGVAGRVAPRVDRVDRILVRVLLGVLCGLSLVIVASALNRMRVYDDAYGFTRERIAVGATEIWLGVVFLLILAAGLRLRAGFVARAAAFAAVLTLLTVAYANPDAFIANHDVDRYQRTGRIDVTYLSRLSADAIPALDRLPETQRSCTIAPIVERMEESGDDWRSWNLGRQLARNTVLPGPFAC